MKKYSIKLAALLVISITTSISSFAEENITIKTNLSSKNSPIEVRLLGGSSDFYQLSVSVGNTNKLSNDKLIPTRAIRNSGGIEIFRGIAIANDHLILNLYFCSPSSTICFDRHIFIDLTSEALSITREETTVFSGSLAAHGVFYNNSKKSINSIDYQHILESDNYARDIFTNKYGTCVSSLSGDSIIKIIDELEKPIPSNWLLEKNCIKPLLVIELSAKNEVSQQATERYLKKFAFKFNQEDQGGG
jgi:hypothetical protein